MEEWRSEILQIAAYGCLRTYAQLLGHQDAAKALAQAAAAGSQAEG